MQQSKQTDLEGVRARLDALEGKLQSSSVRQDKPQPELKSENASWGLAVRVSSDFIAAIFVGGLLGFGLDHFLGTQPFGLIILLLLGFAAGVLNVMRTLGFVAQPSPGRMRQDDAGPTPGKDG